MSSELDTVKNILRESLSAKKFLQRVNSNGFTLVSQDFLGQRIAGTKSVMIMTVLKDQGPDLIWNLAFSDDGDEPVSIVVEGKIAF